MVGGSARGMDRQGSLVRVRRQPLLVVGVAEHLTPARDRPIIAVTNAFREAAAARMHASKHNLVPSEASPVSVETTAGGVLLRRRD